MRLTKSQSIAIAIGSLCLFFAGVAVLVSNKGNEPPPDSEGAPSSSAPAEGRGSSAVSNSASPYIINNFSRSESKGGQKLWEIWAVKGQYYPQDGKVILDAPKLELYQKNGKSVRLTANNALLKLDGASVGQADVSGEVKVQNEQATIETEKATWDRASNILTAEGLVRITSPIIEVSGRKLRVDLNTNVAVFGEEVSSVIQPRKPDKG